MAIFWKVKEKGKTETERERESHAIVIYLFAAYMLLPYSVLKKIYINI